MALTPIKEKDCKSPCFSCEPKKRSACEKNRNAETDLSDCVVLRDFRYASVSFDADNLFIGSTTGRLEIAFAEHKPFVSRSKTCNNAANEIADPEVEASSISTASLAVSAVFGTFSQPELALWGAE